jgi:hypothetical protein
LLKIPEDPFKTQNALKGLIGYNDINGMGCVGQGDTAARLQLYLFALWRPDFESHVAILKHDK